MIHPVFFLNTNPVGQIVLTISTPWLMAKAEKELGLAGRPVSGIGTDHESKYMFL